MVGNLAHKDAAVVVAKALLVWIEWSAVALEVVAVVVVVVVAEI